ncbi:MAG: DUF2892 domain-containing protein [Leptospiraceae bacterium]|nr:DUF2892 domain-containing protein [Leptospiraceae bacterium]
MSSNVGSIDRVLRIVAGIALLAGGLFGLGGLQGETTGVIVAAVAAVPLLTGLLGWCPPYALFGISTKKS